MENAVICNKIGFDDLIEADRQEINLQEDNQVPCHYKVKIDQPNILKYNSDPEQLSGLKSTSATTSLHVSELNNQSSSSQVTENSENCQVAYSSGRKVRQCRLKKELPMPTRESQRKRRRTKFMNYEESEPRNIWSEKEKIQLLKGLEEFGSDDIESLRTYLPFRDPSEIQSKIEAYKEWAQSEIRNSIEEKKKKSSDANNLSTLDEWIEHLGALRDKNPGQLFALSNVFLLIAEFGKFPHPNELNGIDLRQAYRWLHCLINGKPFYGVNHPTADFLNMSTTYLTAYLKHRSHRLHLQPQLLNLPQMKPPIRNYGRSSTRGLSVKSNPEVILSLPHINPFHLPKNVLRKPEVENYKVEEDFISEASCDEN